MPNQSTTLAEIAITHPARAAFFCNTASTFAAVAVMGIETRRRFEVPQHDVRPQARKESPSEDRNRRGPESRNRRSSSGR